MSTPYDFGRLGGEMCRWNNGQEKFLHKNNHQLEPPNSRLKFWLGRVQWQKKINHSYLRHNQRNTVVVYNQKEDYDFCQISSI